MTVDRCMCGAPRVVTVTWEESYAFCPRCWEEYMRRVEGMTSWGCERAAATMYTKATDDHDRRIEALRGRKNRRERGSAKE